MNKFEKKLKQNAYDKVPDKWNQIREKAEIAASQEIKIEHKANYKPYIAAAASIIIIAGCAFVISHTRNKKLETAESYNKENMQTMVVTYTEENGEIETILAYIAEQQGTTILLDEEGEEIDESTIISTANVNEETASIDTVTTKKAKENKQEKYPETAVGTTANIKNKEELETEITTPSIKRDAIITDTFIIKEIHGTQLILSKYEKGNGELKGGLYSGNIGGINVDSLNFNEGDLVSVSYDIDIQETYPMGITIREIYIIMECS